MSALARVLAGIDTLSRVCGYVAAVLVLGIAALILAEIFCRTALNISLSFAWEYAAYFFAVSIFLAAAFALRTGGYVRVMLLAQSVPPRLAYWLDVAATVAGTMIAGVLAWALTAFAARVMGERQHVCHHRRDAAGLSASGNGLRRGVAHASARGPGGASARCRAAGGRRGQAGLRRRMKP